MWCSERFLNAKGILIHNPYDISERSLCFIHLVICPQAVVNGKMKNANVLHFQWTTENNGHKLVYENIYRSKRCPKKTNWFVKTWSNKRWTVNFKRVTPWDKMFDYVLMCGSYDLLSSMNFPSKKAVKGFGLGVPVCILYN